MDKVRDIKFRAWDKIYNQMFTVKSLHIDNLVVRSNSLTFYSLDDINLMQYTGLKDKNGVEIYEGDLIRGPFDFGPAGYSYITSEVCFDKEQGYQWEYWLLEELEVIGNIYENKELLED